MLCSTFNVSCSWDGLRERRNCFCVWSFWYSELCSVDQSSKRECAGCEGSRGIFGYSWVQFLESGEGCTNDSLSSPDYPSLSSEVRCGSWAEPDRYWRAEDGFNDVRLCFPVSCPCVVLLISSLVPVCVWLLLTCSSFPHVIPLCS